MNKYRTHNCSELSEKEINNTVYLSGWLHRKRDHGNLLFIDLRDHYGVTQCVVENNNDFFPVLEKSKPESVLKISGKVVKRASGTENLDLKTGKIEVSIKSVEQLESGLHYASISPIAEPVVDDQAVLAKFPELINVLSQLKEHPQVKSLPLEIDLLSAESVSYQLAGLIPITPIQKQSLLEAFDASQRMNMLAKIVNKISENSS